jgi:putative lipoic acid-binding regulatory protein
MTDKNPTFMQFPCLFSIKIIGNNTANFVTDITDIVKTHYPALSEDAIRCKPSQDGHYIAITATVPAIDQASLDALYMAVGAHPDIKMVL